MADNKFYTVTKEIDGVKYTAQFNGLSAALEAVDSTYIEGTSNTSMMKMAEYLFENVIVEPKGLTPDSFDSLDDMSKVTEFARGVMHGDFRDKKDNSTAKAKG